jgi:ABC-2 type transport system ATP-binding protein
MIDIQHLHTSYGAKKVLDGLNLTLEAGRVYGLVGENGAGKTTLFRCIAGLNPCSGVILSPWPRLKDHLGFLPTQPYFLSKMTGREYLQLLCNARGVRILDFEQYNIFELPLHEYAEHYSTGMKKKLALLGILLQKNEFFILDEPFNGVDIQSNMLISAIIQKLRVQGKTLLISSHIFSTLQDTCDEIQVLSEGRIQKKASRDEFPSLEEEMQKAIEGISLERIWEAIM